MGSTATKPRVTRVLLDNPGQDMHIEVLAEATGLTVKQARNAVNGLVREERIGIVRVAPSVYRYEPDATKRPAPGAAGAPERPADPETDKSFKAIGADQRGDTIAQGAQTGKLYRVVPL